MILLPARESKAARYVEYDLGLKKWVPLIQAAGVVGN